jgi:hypothetical protein
VFFIPGSIPGIRNRTFEKKQEDATAKSKNPRGKNQKRSAINFGKNLPGAKGRIETVTSLI